ncbi:Miy3p RNJ42_01634 [Nakaseomyces bracarensis]|uniref:Miy3p n=1 Tax=Nakaseomyces bracarensis TaxID=273131 RepID=UPI0038728AA5
MSEVYGVKNIDFNGEPARILLHGGDGPSALIALANVLILSPSHKRVATQLKYLLNSKNYLTDDELLDELANIGVTNSSYLGAPQDKEQLLNLLRELKHALHTNPQFNGAFAESLETSVFSTFNVGLVHGWIVDGEKDPLAYQHLSKYSYEAAQMALVQAFEINKKKKTEDVNVSEHQLLEDSTYIKSFLARSATQLTEYGLNHLKEILVEQSFAVLYRSDHYFTLYKVGGELYTLVTDPQYGSSKEVIWMSLRSVNGTHDVFYTSNFFASNNQDSSTANLVTEPMQTTTTNPFSDPPVNGGADDYGLNQANTQQLDDDEMLARQLQEEEDRRAADLMQSAYTRERPPRTENNKSKMDDKKNKRRSFIPHLSKKSKGKGKKNCIIM